MVNKEIVYVDKPINHIINQTKVVEVIKEVPVFKEIVRQEIKEVEVRSDKIIIQEV